MMIAKWWKPTQGEKSTAKCAFKKGHFPITQVKSKVLLTDMICDMSLKKYNNTSWRQNKLKTITFLQQNQKEQPFNKET